MSTSYQIKENVISFDKDSKVTINGKKIQSTNTDLTGPLGGKVLKAVIKLKKFTCKELAVEVYQEKYNVEKDVVKWGSGETNPFDTLKPYLDSWNNFFERELLDLEWEDLEKARATLKLSVKVLPSEKVRQNYLKKLYDEFELFNKRNDNTQSKNRKVYETYVYPRFSGNKKKSLTRPFIKNNDKIFVQARSGSGKSMLMYALCLSQAARALRNGNLINDDARCFYEEFNNRIFEDSSCSLFPVLIECKDYNDESDLLKCAKFSDNEAFIELVEEALKNKNLLVCVDSLDETPLGKQNNFKNAFAELTKKDGCTVIVTSRYINYPRAELDGFRNITLEGFSEIDIESYVKKLQIPLEDVESIICSIKNNETIKSLVENPLILESVISNYLENFEAATTYEIVNDYVKKTLDRFKKQDSIASLLNKVRNEIIEVSGFVAWEMLKNNITEKDLVSFQTEIIDYFDAKHKESVEFGSSSMAEYTKEIKRYIKENIYDIANLNGLVDICGGDNGELKVVFHEALKYFLASKYIGKRYNSPFYKKSRKYTDRFVVIYDIHEKFIEKKPISSGIAETISFFFSENNGAYLQSYTYFLDFLFIRFLNASDDEKNQIKKIFKYIANNEYGPSVFTAENQPPEEKRILEFFVENYIER